MHFQDNTKILLIGLFGTVLSSLEIWTKVFGLIGAISGCIVSIIALIRMIMQKKS